MENKQNHIINNRLKKPQFHPEFKSKDSVDTAVSESDSQILPCTIHGYEHSIYSDLVSRQNECEQQLCNQLKINLQMRNQQIHWMFSVRPYLNLSLETIFGAVIYVDQFLNVQDNVDSALLPLLVLSSLLISSKIHQRYALLPSKLHELCRKRYSAEDIIYGESLILQKLEFRLNATTVYEVFTYFTTLYKIQATQSNLEYMTKCLILDQFLLASGPHDAGVAAFGLYCKIMALNVDFNKYLKRAYNYDKCFSRLKQLINPSRMRTPLRNMLETSMNQLI